jgi:hypothetical protein
MHRIKEAHMLELISHGNVLSYTCLQKAATASSMIPPLKTDSRSRYRKEATFALGVWHLSLNDMRGAATGKLQQR